MKFKLCIQSAYVRYVLLMSLSLIYLHSTTHCFIMETYCLIDCLKIIHVYQTLGESEVIPSGESEEEKSRHTHENVYWTYSLFLRL